MKTESNIRPASKFEIEALPPIEGRSCTVILYDNIQGPFTRQASGEDQEPQEYFTFDRYTVDTIYREASLQQSQQTQRPGSRMPRRRKHPENSHQSWKS